MKITKKKFQEAIELAHDAGLQYGMSMYGRHCFIEGFSGQNRAGLRLKLRKTLPQPRRLPKKKLLEKCLERVKG